MQASAQNNNAGDEKPAYGFDTTLKGGYSLYFATDDSLQYLYLRKGATLKILSTEEINHRSSLLGFVPVDFDDYFVLAHTLHTVHQQDPIICELYDKKKMTIVLKADYISGQGNYLLLHNISSVTGDSMQLYNVVTRQTESFPFPMQDSGDDRLVNAIKIKTIAPGNMTVTYYTNADFVVEKVKTYKRKMKEVLR